LGDSIFTLWEEQNVKLFVNEVQREIFGLEEREWGMEGIM
jgi:hypothetical protein